MRNDVQTSKLSSSKDQESSAAPQRTGAGTRVAIAGRTVRVLLVDDDAADRDLARALLARIRDANQYEVVAVETYEAAREALLNDGFEVCLLDYSLGDRDGIELLRDVMKVAKCPPVIFLTGRADRSIEQRALATGAADFLVKGEITAAHLERSVRHSLERTKNFEALRERERQFRSVFEAALDALLILDDDGRCLDANDAAAALFGLARERLLTMHIYKLLSADTRWPNLLDHGIRPGELVMRRADGSKRFVEFRARANFTPKRHLLVLRDVTMRRHAEAQRLRLAAVVESAADAIAVLTLDATIEYWSPAARRIFGHATSEILRQPMRVLLPADRGPEFDELFARACKGETMRDIESVCIRKDGSSFDASITMSPVFQDDVIVAISVITRDITEKRKLETHLALSDAMVSVGTLAAGVAHEINNPLTAVVSSLDIASRSLAEPGRAELSEAIVDARAATEQIREVVRDLRLFSRPAGASCELVELPVVIESCLRMARNEIRHRARIVRDYAPVPRVAANEARLAQVFLNLLVNAAQAIREGDVERNQIHLGTRTDAAGRAIVTVRDTGAGIEPEALDKLFEPFFTTKPIGTGTGLGLSICWRIIHELGGSIDVSSTVGAGTEFRVTLPGARETRVDAPEPASPVPKAPCRAKLLVIDDEPLVAKVVQRALAQEHEVSCAASAREALELLQAGERFDLIICDMMMPQMTGMDFYVALSEIQPSATERIVFLTGGAFTQASREFLEAVPNLHIEKPFDAAQLCALVNQQLAAIHTQR